MSITRTLEVGWRRGQHGWPPAFPLVQFPNAPLLVGLGGSLVAALTEGSLRSCALVAAHAGLLTWAWKEVSGGVNWVRRALGAGGLVYLAATIARALGA